MSVTTAGGNNGSDVSRLIRRRTRVRASASIRTGDPVILHKAHPANTRQSAAPTAWNGREKSENKNKTISAKIGCGTRPNLQNSGRAGDQLIRDPHN